MTTPHPLAEFIHAFADGKKVQFERPDMGWINCTTLLDFSSYSDCKWRFKPDTLVVNGVEVPKPDKYLASIDGYTVKILYSDRAYHIVYRTHDDATVVFEALTKPFKESP